MVSWLAAATAVLGEARDADRWDPATRRRTLAAFDTVSNALTVARARVVTAERDAGTWALTGDRDLAGFLGRTGRQGPGVGLAQVAQAETLTSLPAVADAMVDGPMTPKHVQEITRATAASPMLAAELATSEGQASLVALAGRLDGPAFGRRLRQLGAALDPVSRQRDHDRQRADRFLLIAHGPGGTDIKARLDSVAGYKFAKAIDALSPRPAQDDVRPRQVRQADALMTMVDRVLSDERTTPGATAPVQALVTFSEATWAALRAADASDGADESGARTDGASETARRPEPGSTADVVNRMRGVPPATDELGQPWPASEIARALCDCTLTRVVLGATGKPLDLGWKDRLFTRAQWLALYASGVTTCAVDGCSMPLRYTELHHMRWWKQHRGRTDLANCAPECAFHHGEVHRLELTVTRRPDGSYEHLYPDGRRYGGAPPGTDSRPPGADGPEDLSLTGDAVGDLTGDAAGDLTGETVVAPALVAARTR